MPMPLRAPPLCRVTSMSARGGSKSCRNKKRQVPRPKKNKIEKENKKENNIIKKRKKHESKKGEKEGEYMGRVKGAGNMWSNG